MSRPKEPRGYRRKRQIPPWTEPPPRLEGLAETIIGADQIARITQEAAAQAPLPDPEDLLVAWAREYYRGGNPFFVWQIGFYVAEDLKLRGLVRDERPEE